MIRNPFSLEKMAYKPRQGRACPMSGANASPKAPTFGGYGEVVEFTLTKKVNLSVPLSAVSGQMHSYNKK